jgi:hypothetical protein
MAKSAKSSNAPTKIGVQQIVLFLVLVGSMFYFFQMQIIPWVTAQFVVSQFKPSGETMERMELISFEGLTWASTSKSNAAKIIKEGISEPSKKLINREYIFDFSFKSRNMEEHGYVKGASEWYAKSEILGEYPIILEPWIGFWWLAMVLAVIVTLILSIFLPKNLGFMATLIDRQIDNTKIKIRLQTGFSDEIVEMLTMPDDKLNEKEISEVERIFQAVWDRTVPEEIASAKQAIRFEDVFDENTDIVAFRNEALFARIKEYFSDFVLVEIEDTKDGLDWRRNHLLIFKGLRLYMTHHFTEKYANNVTGLAYGGAAFLIVAVGIRGLKFIPAQKPSFILLAIFLEFTMLSLLAITLMYTEEEERMDKMLKKMEDANKGQLEVQRLQQYDIHQLKNSLVGGAAEIVRQRVESAVVEYLAKNENLEGAIKDEFLKTIRKALIHIGEEESKRTV